MRDGSAGFEAMRLLEGYARSGNAGLLCVTQSEERAEAVARFLRGAAREVPVLVFRPWDCLPYDTASPSPEVMGHRMRVLRQLRAGFDTPPIVLTSVDAALQRVPPPEAVEALELARGRDLDPEALRRFCAGAGYVEDDRVDEPGEIAVRGEVIDIFPAACKWPHRIELDRMIVAAIRCYDPVSQRSMEEVDTLTIDPVSELPGTGDEQEDVGRGAEHRLPEAYPALASIFDYAPDARIWLGPGADRLRRRTLGLIREAYGDREAAAEGSVEAGRRPLRPDRLYLLEDEWQARVEGAEAINGGWAGVPSFIAASRPRSAFAAFLEQAIGEGHRVLLCAPSASVMSRFKRRARLRGERAPREVKDLAEVLAAPKGAVLSLVAPLDEGFVDKDANVAVVAAADLLGARIASAEDARRTASWGAETSEFHLKDIVVHFDHGVSALEGLGQIESNGAGGEAIRLHYAEEQVLLVPSAEAGRLWRYGSEDADVARDKLNTQGWLKRRNKISADLAVTARKLLAEAEARAARKAARLLPPEDSYERFCDRFPYPLTPDQRAAVDAVLEDLGSGTPMNRLVVGDVGFGKTEVALRGAAVAALAGAQVALVAPTTVLARQHFDTFRRRFDGFKVEVAHLSRLVPPREAKQVRERLASGEVRVVVGTHALLGKGVAFANLGLLIVDEEQRFGAQHKAKLRRLREDAHVLTMTATPIPRTLQGALVGLQDLSAIATPPLRRRAIRTFVAERSDASLRQALLREQRRGGQSFLVVPRVEDIEPTRDILRELVPRLEVVVAHGQMPARDVDEAVVGFAAGKGDVLLATSIIESGLDVPRANTMVVLRPDLFGLAQLHQLRGRVGRSHLQAYCYLMSAPGMPLSEEATRRLGTLQALDQLGAGMAIAMHDLDLRGAGDLFGERQAGHVKLIGLGLYQELLADALKAAKGDPEDLADVALQADADGFIPEDYVPEAVVRINLYHRLARALRAEAVDALADEISDRFGPPPEPVRHLLEGAAVRALARALGVTRISAGPQGVSLSFAAGADVEALLVDAAGRFEGKLDWNGERLLYAEESASANERRDIMLDLLHELS